VRCTPDKGCLHLVNLSTSYWLSTDNYATREEMHNTMSLVKGCLGPHAPGSSLFQFFLRCCAAVVALLLLELLQPGCSDDVVHYVPTGLPQDVVLVQERDIGI
jgi:hypothetical protein